MLVLPLFGCSSNSENTELATGNGLTAPQASAPIKLIRPSATSNQPAATAQLPEADVRKAIEHYAINKGLNPRPYQIAGSDLNSDGQPEALVYFSGEKWCAKTGCTLAVFSQSTLGYRPITTVRRVRRPILLGDSFSEGWRQINVSTGGSGMVMKRVPLRFSAGGYPGNASTITPLGPGIGFDGLVLFAKPAHAIARNNSTGQNQGNQAVPSALNQGLY